LRKPAALLAGADDRRVLLLLKPADPRVMISRIKPSRRLQDGRRGRWLLKACRTVRPRRRRRRASDRNRGDAEALPTGEK